MSDPSVPAPRCSVVILNHEGGDLLAPAVRSALEQEDVDVEVIVVDNGSVDGSIDRLTPHPRLEVIRLDRNVGYAAGMNVGLRRATGDVVVPMNCDAALHPGFLRAGLARLASDPTIGCVAPLVLRVPDLDRRPWDTRATTELDGGAVDLAPHMSVHLSTDVPAGGACFKANGACPIHRRAALDEVVRRFGGPFDESFGTYGEDTDLAFKLWRTGWRTVHDPEARAAHVRSFGSAVRVADKRGHLRVRVLSSRHRNAVRHLRSRQLAVALALGAAADVVFAVARLVRGDRMAARDVVVAWRTAARHLRRDLAVRRRTSPLVSPPGVFRWRLVSRRPVPLGRQGGT